MKHLKGLILLGLLGLVGVGSQTATAQTIRSVRIGLTSENVSFFVDGQVYKSTQIFLWPDGSTHVIQFPFSVEADGTVSPYQYYDGNQVRYAFNGWGADGGVVLDSGPVTRIMVDSSLGTITGQVRVEYRVELEFQALYTNDFCSRVVEVQDIDRPGALIVDDVCYARAATLWMTPGPHELEGRAYPGYTFTGFQVGETTLHPTVVFQLNVTGPSRWKPFFTRAKRVNFSTIPAGLDVLVDRALLDTVPTFPFNLPPGTFNDYCDSHYFLPVKTPAGVPAMCIGDFDFQPGSEHQIGAPSPQVDENSNRWIFDHFSNGLGQNGIYVTPNDTENVDFITAYFVKGVPANILTNPPGLTIEIDGVALPPPSIYGFYWGQGHTHHLKAPETQRDKKGRMWKFVNWSDGGEREHDVTVAPDATGFLIHANYEPLGQIQITSSPAGQLIQVNGEGCTTPCSYDALPGAKLNMVAQGVVDITQGTRLEFEGWAGHSTATALEATFDADVQFFVANYHTSHLVQAVTDPQGGASFEFTPSSTDGYFREGTNVQVKVVPHEGYKFLAWRGDLDGHEKTEFLQVLAPLNIIAHLEEVPTILPAGIQSAAGDNPQHTVAPGSLIAIYGVHLADSTEIGPGNPLKQTLANVWVTVGQSILPVMFVSPTQINALLVSTIPEGEHTLTVHNYGKPDITGTFKVRRNSPGIFYTPQENGTRLVAALHQDGKLITMESPAQRGEIVTFFTTGGGPYDRPVVDGFPLPLEPFYYPIDPVKIVLSKPQPEVPEGQQPPPPVQTVKNPHFIAGTATVVGLTTVQVKLDGDLPPGNLLELKVVVNQLNTETMSDSNTVHLPIQ